MNSTSTSSTTCISTMKLLGDYWTLRIIDTLKSGETRFCDLQRSIDNVNPVTLTSRLKKLETAHLIVRSEKLPDKIAVSYSLSNLGREVLPVIMALDQFSVKAKVTA